MGKKQRVIRVAIIALLLAALGVLAWQMIRPGNPEPIYQGKPLSFWLEAYDPGNHNLAHPNGPAPPTYAQADAAIRHMGTSAIPILLQMLQRDSKFRNAIVQFLQKQHVVKIRYTPDYPNLKALNGFRALGPAASNAVPRLIALFDRDPSPFPQTAVPTIFGEIGPAAGQAIPTLLRAASHTNEIVRNNAIFALSQIHSEPTQVVPVLIKCLNDPVLEVRSQAARALGAYGKDAESAVPALIELWRKEPSEAISGMQGRTTFNTMVVLSWGPSLAGSAGPGLGVITNPAQEALKAIDPEAAEKAGVK